MDDEDRLVLIATIASNALGGGLLKSGMDARTYAHEILNTLDVIHKVATMNSQWLSKNQARINEVIPRR